MRLPARFRLKAFPTDNRLWKVDWFGDLLRNPNAGSEPLLEVFIVPFKRGETTEEYLKQKSSYEYSQTRKIKVGVSLLPFLHLGTFWRAGIHQTAALSERVVLRNLKNDAVATRIVNAKNFQAKDELLDSFPSIEGCLETNFLEIDFPSKPKKKILIPCYEIIRFYFAGSSNLTRRIITGGIRTSPNALFDETQTNLDVATGHGNLILRGKLVGTDRHTVARLAFSEIANNAAWGVYSSIVKNFNNTGRRIAEASFPFVGNTNLQVCGKWFKEGDVWHLLVYFIESCSHPLPYKQLAWGIEGEREVNTGDKGGKKEHWINRTDDKTTDERGVGSDDEPTLKALFAEALFDGQKFTDLQNKEAETRLKSDKALDGSIRYRVVTVETDEKRELSTAEGTFGASKAQGLDIKIGEDKKTDDEIEDAPKIIPAGWDLFNNILVELEKDKAIKTNVLSFISDSDSLEIDASGYAIYFPHFISGKKIAWSFLDKEYIRRRQAMLAEILISGKFYYLFDTETRIKDHNDHYSMILIYNKDFTRIKTSFWQVLFSDCATFRGRKRDKWKWDDTNRETFRHDLTGHINHALRISTFIHSLSN